VREAGAAAAALKSTVKTEKWMPWRLRLDGQTDRRNISLLRASQSAGQCTACVYAKVNEVYTDRTIDGHLAMKT